MVNNDNTSVFFVTYFLCFYHFHTICDIFNTYYSVYIHTKNVYYNLNPTINDHQVKQTQKSPIKKVYIHINKFCGCTRSDLSEEKHFKKKKSDLYRKIKFIGRKNISRQQNPTCSFSKKNSEKKKKIRDKIAPALHVEALMSFLANAAAGLAAGILEMASF